METPSLAPYPRHEYQANPALKSVRFALWTLRDKAAQR